MGREVRMVPPNWVHPENYNGEFIPLLRDYKTSLEWWQEEKAKYNPDEHDDAPFEECYGHEPQPEEYMPDFEPGTATHYRMYETCTEGTPISPACATPEELAHWLADNNASAFGYEGASYEAWLKMITGSGFAVSCVISNGIAQSGVEAGI